MEADLQVNRIEADLQVYQKAEWRPTCR